MHLSEAQSQRFFNLFFPLVVFANSKLKVVEGPFKPWANEADQQALADVCQQLWANPCIIDEFISANAESWDTDDLEQISRWKNGIADTFILGKHQEDCSLLLADDGVFAVQGITQELSSLLPDTPRLVKTVIIPFEDRLTYALNIVNYPLLKMDDEALGAIDSQIENAREQVAVISTDKQLAEQHLLRVKRAVKEQADKIGRNEPCPCGSGKKFKKCCGSL